MPTKLICTMLGNQDLPATKGATQSLSQALHMLDTNGVGAVFRLAFERRDGFAPEGTFRFKEWAFMVLEDLSVGVYGLQVEHCAPEGVQSLGNLAVRISEGNRVDFIPLT